VNRLQTNNEQVRLDNQIADNNRQSTEPEGRTPLRLATGKFQIRSALRNRPEYCGPELYDFEELRQIVTGTLLYEMDPWGP